jgi:hypothetical protein
MRVFPANRQSLVYLDILTSLYTATAKDALVGIVAIEWIGIIDLVGLGAERCLLMFDPQELRRVMDSTVAVVVVTNGAVEKVVTQNPVKRLSLSYFCPDRLRHDVHPR